MNHHKLFQCIFAQFFACILLFSLSSPVARAAKLPGSNRFNVVIVMDDSGSIEDTDPDGYRFEAIRQFTNLLADQGNTLGGVVFSTDIVGEHNLGPIQDQAGKDAVVSMLESASAQKGWTNTGAALSRAVEMIQAKGDSTLPSVILLLSDGNTAMGTDEETQTSLSLKDDAVLTARENGIAVYSVCLNANQEADVTEMQRISSGTGGVFREVTAAEDLRDVFNTFYELIYRTSTIPLYSGVFPDSGQLEVSFSIPGLGVEEVNIIIYGNAASFTLLRPNGEESRADQRDGGTFSMLKLTDIIPGTWKLIAEGVPGDDIKINMVYNTNLGIEVGGVHASQVVHPADPVTITARLTGNNVAATNSQQYVGYSAELKVMDAYENEVESRPMQVVDDRFEVVHSFNEGTYYCRVVVTGYHIEWASESLGPLISTASVQTEPERNNTPPTPVQEVVETTVNLWPILGGSYTLDLNTLAADAEDSRLQYKIISSSFLENVDYTVDSDGVFHLDRFDFNKGAFTVQATDSGGLSCEIEVIVHVRNIGLITLIVLIALAALAAVIFGILLYIALNKPFWGKISPHSYCNAVFKGTPRSPKRGRCKLSVFGMDNVGLDYQKSYFQATGKDYIELHTNIPVIWNGQETNTVRIASGVEVMLTIRRGDPRVLYVRFDSYAKNKPRRSTRPKRR